MAKHQRKPVTKKTRFEVFKRDGFKCQYCGRSAPDVVLEVDHIIPVCKGGDNDLLNLVTACFDCNRGKTSKSLDDSTVVSKQMVQLQDLNTRREQLEMLADWRQGLQNIEAQKVDMVVKEICSKFGIVNPDVKQQTISVITNWVKKYEMVELFDAIDQVRSKNDRLDWNVFMKIEKHVKFSKIPEAQQKLLYIRGIVRNRLDCRYYDDKKALSILNNAIAAGVDLVLLQDFAKTVTTWQKFRAGVEDLISSNVQRL